MAATESHIRKSVAGILKQKYRKPADSSSEASDTYLSHHGFVDALVDNYLAVLARATKEEEEKAKGLIAELEASITSAQKKLAEMNAQAVAIGAQTVTAQDLLALCNKNVELHQQILAALDKNREILAGKQADIKKLSEHLHAQTTSLRTQNLTGSPRQRLDEQAHDLYTKLWRIQTYKNIEVVILYGFAVPSYLLAVETFAIEGALGEIGIEHPGVDLGISIGLFVSVSMMCIAAFLRKTLRRTWEEEIDPAFEAYKKGLKDFYTQIGVEDKDDEIEKCLAANVKYARKNWVPSASVPELGKPGFRVNALHDGCDVKSDDRLEHGKRKDKWFMFYMLMGAGSLIGGIWTAAFAHETLSRIPDRPKPDFPWENPPIDPGAQSASSSHTTDDGLAAPEIALIAMAAVGLLAAVYLVWDQRQKTTNNKVHMSASAASGSATLTSSMNTNHA